MKANCIVVLFHSVHQYILETRTHLCNESGKNKIFPSKEKKIFVHFFNKKKKKKKKNIFKSLNNKLINNMGLGTFIYETFQRSVLYK